MIPVTEELLQEMTDRIVEAVHPRKVILFGSHARGDAGPDSDVDLLVVVDGEFGPGHSRWQELERVRRLLSHYRIPKDLLAYTQAEFESWRTARNHVISHAMREGRVLYERS